MLFGMKDILDTKIAFLHQFDLGYVYLAVYITSLARQRIIVNANATRAAARVDRPDQHVYKLMDPRSSSTAPYVLMATSGWAGKFNRAQRGAFNTDETLPHHLVNTLLAGAVYGPAIMPLALLSAYGRIKFALLYTESADKRGAGFLPALVGEQWTGGLVLLTAIKAIGGSAIPF